MARSRSPPVSPGQRRKTVPSLRRPLDGFASYEHGHQHRPDTVPVGKAAHALRGREAWIQEGAEGKTEGGGDFVINEWIKGSWKKGECRAEIMLVAETAGLTFDNTRVVTLRLFNHFHWLPQLQERVEKLRSLVGRERRLSFSVVRQQGAAGTLSGSYTVSAARGKKGGHRGGGGAGDEDSCGSADDGRGGDGGGYGENNGFNRYVRGLCAICQEGSFDQKLDLLLRAYSTGREGRTIDRTELATVLERHILYADFEDPTAEKERVYRWLKRQFIDLAASKTTTAPVGSRAIAERKDGPTNTEIGSSSVFITWENARKLLRQGPHGLEDALAIDLPRLSKDLWAADLADGHRITTTAVTVARESQH